MADVTIPIYGITLMGVSMLIMLIVIVYLLFLLKRAKGTEYKFFTSQDKTMTAERAGFSRQASNDVQSVKNVLCPITTITDCDGIKVEEPYFKHTSSIRDIYRNDPTTSNREKYESKVNPKIKRNLHSNVILPEQMRQICRDVLSKRLVANSTSSRDLNELLNEIDTVERRPSGSKKGLAREKSASSPELDLDIYDTLPSSAGTDSDEKYEVAVNEVPLTDKAKEDRTTKRSQLRDSIKIGENNVLDIEGDDIPLYDSPPVSSIKDSQYLLPLKTHPSKETPLLRESIKSNKDNAVDIEDGDDIPLYDSPPDTSFKNSVTEDSQYLIHLRKPANGPSLLQEQTKVGKNNANIEDGDDIPLYDSPPVSTIRNTVIEDSQYLLPLRSTPSPNIDPSYINANCNKFIL